MGMLFEILDLQKRYGDVTALDIKSLAIEQGGRYAIIGPNGAGKSTLLRILAGTLEPTCGQVGFPPGCRLRYLPQHPFVFDVSVRRNVAMAAGKGLPAAERNRRVDEALRMVGMQEMAQARGSQLSGGQAQRVSLARLFVNPCDVLLLDEPTSAMDVRGTRAVEEALSAFLQHSGATLLMCTHAPAQALRVSTQVVLLDEGRVVECGPSAQVIDDPATDAAREFLSYWRI